MNQEQLLNLIAALVKTNETETKPCKETTDQGQIRIVILQRGWVYIGKYYQQDMNCWLEDAHCIRAWGTSKGLGELAENGPLTNTKLDKCPIVRFHRLTAVATIDCNQSVWKSKI